MNGLGWEYRQVLYYNARYNGHIDASNYILIRLYNDYAKDGLDYRQLHII